MNTVNKISVQAIVITITVEHTGLCRQLKWNDTYQEQP